MGKKYIISGGGTGGHIFPAIAIANEIKARDPEAAILFVGAKGKMEMTKVPEAGYTIEGLWISGIKRSLSIDNLMFPFKLLSSVWKSLRILKKFKPDAVIGVGGFASGPLLYAATLKKYPTLIQEQNSYPGITNKLLAGRVDKICTAYEGMDRFFPKEKMVLTGNPIRSELLIPHGVVGAKKEWNVPSDKKIILILGGSLGARSMNEFMVNKASSVLSDQVHWLWQCGAQGKEMASSFVKNKEIKNITVLPFIKNMSAAYALADVVVSRAGAMAVSEIAAIGKCSVFVPFPFASEDHQTKNAQSLVNKNAALLVKDKELSFNLESLLCDLLINEQEIKMYETKIKELGKPNALNEIVNEIEKLLDK